ncbi:MAG: hypothetical protein EON53_13680 [Actinomycetales bacterium]|nr:MAG: hypothetical protein EON53_13680 [Actinomycetales bacterium]
MSSLDVLSVTGTAAIREKIALPGGGVLSVKLVSPDGEVLAAVAVNATDGPTPFALSADPALVPDPDAVRLWAMLRTDVGVWGTPELVSVREELMLSRVDA